MALTILPDPPSRADPANFAARGDAFMAALPTFVSEFNAQVPNVVAGDQGITGNLVVNGNSTLGNATSDVVTIGVTGIIKDSAGNVGFGITPSSWGANARSLQLTTPGGNAATVSISSVLSSDELLIARNCYYDGTTWRYSVNSNLTQYQQSSAGEHIWYSSSIGTAGASVTPTERMRIDASGNVGIGTTNTSPGVGNTVAGVAFSGSTGIGYFSRASDASGIFNTNTDSPVVRFNRSGTSVGSVSVTATTTTYNTTSDQRLKTTIVDAPASGADIDAIRIRSYDWIADGSHQKYGVIAQELVDVAPYAVDQPDDPEQMMSVDYSKLVPLLVKEVQSLRKRVAELEQA